MAEMGSRRRATGADRDLGSRKVGKTASAGRAVEAGGNEHLFG